LKIRDTEVKGPEPPASAADVTVDSEKSASTGDIVEAVPMAIVSNSLTWYYLLPRTQTMLNPHPCFVPGN
jgi:hypothetical protein